MAWVHAAIACLCLDPHGRVSISKDRMEWKRLLCLARMVLPTGPAFLCGVACPLNIICKNLHLIKSQRTSWNMFCLEAITSYRMPPWQLLLPWRQNLVFLIYPMIDNAVGYVIIHFISLRLLMGSAMTWWFGYSLHSVTLLQHVKLPSLFNVKTNLATLASLLEERILYNQNSCTDSRILPVSQSAMSLWFYLFSFCDLLSVVYHADSVLSDWFICFISFEL